MNDVEAQIARGLRDIETALIGITKELREMTFSIAILAFTLMMTGCVVALVS